ncbi:MAG: GNAT family N-acetyltransferase [Ketobacter sp.]|nr:GNAT family N-acetyltransferase [Ketobacter sp.]
MLYHLGVSPEHQSKGIGQQLIAHLLEQVRVQNLQTAALDVAVTNPRAYALYERIGFNEKVTHSSKLTSPFGHVVDHIYMELTLGEGRPGGT